MIKLYGSLLSSAICAVIGGLLAFLIRFIYNTAPVRWLCGYEGRPDERHLGIRLKRSSLFILVPIMAAAYYCIAWRFMKFWDFEELLNVVCYTVFFGMLLLIAIADFQFNIVPDQFLVGAAVFGAVPYIVKLATRHWVWDWVSPLLALAIGACTFALVNLFCKLVFKRKLFSADDTKLMAICGMALGYDGIWCMLIMTFSLSLLRLIYVLVFKKPKRGECRQFGTFIIASTMITMTLWPIINGIIKWCYSLFM